MGSGRRFFGALGSGGLEEADDGMVKIYDLQPPLNKLCTDTFQNYHWTKVRVSTAEVETNRPTGGRKTQKSV